MKEQVFTIEQMKTLKEVGVNIEIAKGMAYYAIYETEPNWFNELRIRENEFDGYYPYIPTFTTHDAIVYLNNIVKPNKLSIMYNDDCEWVVSVVKIFRHYNSDEETKIFNALHKDPDLNCALYESILKLSTF